MIGQALLAVFLTQRADDYEGSYGEHSMRQTANFFNDGEAYEKVMGRWSRMVGEQFLEWLSVPNGSHWLDVGCGNGAFTELIRDRCAPSAISAIDPAKAQLDFARTRLGSDRVEIRLGDAQSLPFSDDQFDVATMALVISFIPDREKAITEMRRVVRSGGLVAAYIWDMAGNRHTQQPLRDAIEAIGVKLTPLPGIDGSRLDVLQEAFEACGLKELELKEFQIELEFTNFDNYWDLETALPNTTVQTIQAMSDDEVAALKSHLQRNLTVNRSGHIAYGATANAIKGRVPSSS